MKIKVDSLYFSFSRDYKVIKFDKTDSFTHLSSSMQFLCECVKCPSQKCPKIGCSDFKVCNRKKMHEGLKGVDLLARNNKVNYLYLIESKDYRKVISPPTDHIVNEVAKKFRDTLFGIWCGSICDSDPKIQTFLRLARTKKYNIQFIFHFESPKVPYPTGLHRVKKVIPIKDMEKLLKKKLRDMQIYVKVYDMDSKLLINYPWTVTEK